MADTGSRRTTVRLAAALLASLLVAFAVLTYLSYTAAFASVDTVTVAAPRAGLVMDKGAKVKYRGIQIGKVTDINYADDQARLTLASTATTCTSSRPTRRCISRATPFSAPSRWNSFRPKRLRRRPCVLMRTCSLRGAAGSQHPVPVADESAAQGRPGRIERDAECASPKVCAVMATTSAAAFRSEYAYATSEPEAARAAGGLPQDRRRHQHLRRRRPGPEHHLRQPADHQQDRRRRAEESQRHAVGHDRPVQQRL